MNWKKVLAVVRREYIERIRTRAFWIGTLIIPFLLIGIIIVQIAVMRRAGGERRVAVVDRTGRLFAPLEAELARVTQPAPAGQRVRPAESAEDAERAASTGGRNIRWLLENRSGMAAMDLDKAKEQLRKEVLAKKINAYLILDPATIARDRVEYYSTTVSEFVAINQLERALNHVLLRERISARGLPPEIGTELEKRVELKPFKVTTAGTAEEKGAGIVAVIIFFFLMYSTFFMYGYQVMRGVIEEKNNRIVEVIIASVRPTELMLGKIFGIGCVGLTQYFVWAVIAANLSLPGIAGAFAAGEDVIPRIPASLLGYFILFFLCGYFMYASIYTAIAAPFNTDQEAQQFAMIPMVMIISSVAIYPAVMNNPSGGMAVFFSLLPFTAPLMMFLRTSLAPVPAWQIVLSVVLLAGTTVALAWFAGRIYRVGILMYGKKPTVPEIIRWVRYRPGQAVQPAEERAS
jgi:ABC-2 type transport system permease protein